MPIDPVDLTAGLIQCPSVTPEEGGALVLLQDTLERAGFFLCPCGPRGGEQSVCKMGSTGTFAHAGL